jgi:hypothetical protein
MSEDELRLALFGVGITLAFLGMRILLDWEDKKIKFNLHLKR